MLISKVSVIVDQGMQPFPILWGLFRIKQDIQHIGQPATKLCICMLRLYISCVLSSDRAHVPFYCMVLMCKQTAAAVTQILYFFQDLGFNLGEMVIGNVFQQIYVP